MCGLEKRPPIGSMMVIFSTAVPPSWHRNVICSPTKAQRSTPGISVVFVRLWIVWECYEKRRERGREGRREGRRERGEEEVRREGGREG